jgi:hypothetical protein
VSKKVSVQIIIEQTVRYEKTVEMPKAEYDDHSKALDRGGTVSRMRTETLFEKYFDPKNASDYEDPELVEFGEVGGSESEEEQRG